MRRRSNSHSPISLFTFLDTLVCTMGSLILMLLAMTPKIRERAEAREMARLAAMTRIIVPADEPEGPRAGTLPAVVATDPAGDEERQRERERRRQAWLDSTAQARETLAKKHADYRRLRSLVKDAAGRLKQTQDQSLAARLKEESVADAAQALTELETRLNEQDAKVAQRIAETRKSLDLLNRKQSARANEYALIPYDGASGTVRRPIYIECSKRGFRFLPEDETVSPIDLQSFHANYNPLLNGTQTLLRFWSRRRRESGGSEPAPYVLLLVRPSGCLNYYVARNLLAPLGANFGYELVEEDWKLSVPEPEPLAKAVLKETLDLTVQANSQMKDALVDAAQRGGFGRNRRNSSPGGWFDDPSAEEDDDDSGSRPFGGPESKSRTPAVKFGPASRSRGDSQRDDSQGFASKGEAVARSLSAKRPQARPATANGTAGKGTDRNEADGQVEIGAAAGAGRAADMGRGGDSPATGNAGQGGERRAGRGETAGGSAGRVGDDSTRSTSDKGGRTGPTGAVRTRARPAAISGSRIEGDSGEGSPDTDSPLTLPAPYAPRKLPGASGSSGVESGLGGDESGSLKPIPQDSTTGALSAGAGSDFFSGRAPSSGKPIAGAPSRDPSGAAPTGSAASGSPSSAAQRSLSNSSDEPVSDTGAAGGPTVPDLGTGAAASDGSPRAKAQMGGPGATIRLGSKNRQRAGDNDDEADSGPRISDDDAKSGVQKKGRAGGPRLWGKVRPKASIGLERKLEIRVFADRILVGWKDNAIPVGNGETIEEMINHVVVGIDRAAEKWGEPPASFYWLPTVKFVVYPGGNLYYERLRGPLEKTWGVTSVVEYAPDPKSAGKTAGGRP